MHAHIGAHKDDATGCSRPRARPTLIQNMLGCLEVRRTHDTHELVC